LDLLNTLHFLTEFVRIKAKLARSPQGGDAIFTAGHP
jgi:hypothetical protein